MRLLLIEDDADLSATVAEYLEAKGHTAELAYDGLTGLHLASRDGFDVVVLDLGLPGLDGLELCRSVRRSARRDVPILMLTARDTLEDKVLGFEAGADDYLLKPFEMTELLVRLEALHRRASGTVGDEVLRVGDLVVDPGQGRISRAGRSLTLHRIGAEIVTILARESPRIVSREELEQAIWGANTPDRDLLRSHLYLVRQVLDRPFATPLLHTVRGRGVRLAPPEGDA
ncbi:MAG: response regulator transcription factor [Planctomycetota bacterium]